MKVRVRFIDLVLLLVRWKKLVILNFIGVGLVTAAISLVIPKWFQSRATLLPPSDDSGFNFSAILSDLPLAGLGIGSGLDQGTSLIIAIANSRSLREKVIDRFDLVSRFKAENSEEALEILNSHISVDVSDEGMIKLGTMAKTKYFADQSQENETKKLVQDMTTFIVDQIDNKNRLLKNEQAYRNRLFIEKRYFQNISDLKSAEDSLQAFQKKYGVLVLPEQLQASISAMVEVKAQIAMLEMDLSFKKQYFNVTHPEYIQAQNRLTAMKSEYKNMLKGEQNGNNVIIALDSAPDLGIAFARLFRQVKLQETIMEFLLPQYEQAKIQEAKDTPTLQILDMANLPIKRIKPKRVFLVLFACFASILFCVITAYFRLYLQYMKRNDASDFSKVKEILKELKPRFFLNRDA